MLTICLINDFPLKECDLLYFLCFILSYVQNSGWISLSYQSFSFCLFLSLSLSACLCLSVSICLFVCLSVCISMSVCLSLSVCLSMSVFLFDSLSHSLSLFHSPTTHTHTYKHTQIQQVAISDITIFWLKRELIKILINIFFNCYLCKTMA